MGRIYNGGNNYGEDTDTLDTIYLNKTEGALTYLSKADASSTYATKTALNAKLDATTAASTYLGKTEAENTYMPLDVTEIEIGSFSSGYYTMINKDRIKVGTSDGHTEIGETFIAPNLITVGDDVSINSEGINAPYVGTQNGDNYISLNPTSGYGLTVEYSPAGSHVPVKAINITEDGINKVGNWGYHVSDPSEFSESLDETIAWLRENSGSGGASDGSLVIANNDMAPENGYWGSGRSLQGSLSTYLATIKQLDDLTSNMSYSQSGYYILGDLEVHDDDIVLESGTWGDLGNSSLVETLSDMQGLMDGSVSVADSDVSLNSGYWVETIETGSLKGTMESIVENLCYNIHDVEDTSSVETDDVFTTGNDWGYYEGESNPASLKSVIHDILARLDTLEGN